MQKISGSKSINLDSDSHLQIEAGSVLSITINPKNNSKIILDISENCDILVYVIQEKDVSVLLENHIGKNSKIKTFGFWFGSGNAKIINKLIGENAEANDVEVFAQSTKNNFHLDSVLCHANKNTHGNILVKGIVKNSASVKLDGMIKIEKNGSGAESFLSEHVMLLNPGAHAIANPELEIENNDVSSRHAASVSQIDNEKIFYLMTRGISETDSKKLIVDGFLESAILKIEDLKIQKYLLEKTLSKI